jgi:hypothetical protein
VTEERERYIILDVDYRHVTDYGRSLEWLAPELKDAPGLVMTEDDTESENGNVYCGRCKRWMSWLDVDDEDKPCVDDDGHELVTLHRKWAGTIPESTYQKLVSDWSLDSDESEPNLGMLTEFGHLESLSFSFDGMDWNAGGETPIDHADLRVSAYAEVPA